MVEIWKTQKSLKLFPIHLGGRESPSFIHTRWYALCRSSLTKIVAYWKSSKTEDTRDNCNFVKFWNKYQNSDLYFLSCCLYIGFFFLVNVKKKTEKLNWVCSLWLLDKEICPLFTYVQRISVVCTYVLNNISVSVLSSWVGCSWVFHLETLSSYWETSTELSSDHHLRWWWRKLDRPGASKHIDRVRRESLAEAPVHEIFNSHLQQSFDSIPKETGDIRSKWTGNPYRMGLRQCLQTKT